MDPALKRAAREAHARAAELEKRILARYPDAWQDMDRMRADPPQPWPDWCLLPMAAAAAVTGVDASHPPTLAQMITERPPIAAVSALYAWRFTRSVYLVEPALLGRLLTQVPDEVSGVQPLLAPEWCVYVAVADPEFPGVGVWMHLEYDVNTSRPELRILLDPTGEGGPEALLPIPVYLDRDSLTEAIGDALATAKAGLAGEGLDARLRIGQNVRGGELDAAVAAMADRRARRWTARARTSIGHRAPGPATATTSTTTNSVSGRPAGGQPPSITRTTRRTAF